jgi:TIR domain
VTDGRLGVVVGTDSGAGSNVGLGWRWEVALSYAAAQRDYVEQVARALQAQGLRCFYDADEQVELWGKDLAEELPVIYGEQVAAVVVFASAEYAERDWTRLERRAALNRAVRERREYVLPARFDDTPLPGLLSGMVSVDLRGRSAEQFAAMIVSKLASLAIMPAPPADAAGYIRDAEEAGPAGAVRVNQADPRRLGVHAAISVPGTPEEIPPEYVPRDADAGESGVRARVAAAAQRGGFVLLIGGSSVGKTRCAMEAVKALLPDWWLVHPAGPAEITDLARAPTPHTVVWLDELQRYLDGENGLAGAVVRALLNAPHPAVIIGTMWPDLYTRHITLPAPGDADLHAREREVLDLAAVIRIDPAFSVAEQDRARAAVARDPRLKVALEAAGYGLTQTLAAAPQLVARWEDARTASPYAWAVLTAALDTARLGARTPLSVDLLRAAAVGYCTDAQKAEAPDNWFEQALAYGTGKLRGAVAALSPVGAAMGQVDGYVVADYLIQHASQERRYARVPASTWDAAISHIRDADDAARLAASARNRLLFCYAIPLYRHATDLGEGTAGRHLAWLLTECGDLDGAIQILSARVDADDNSAQWLADLLAKRDDLDGAILILRARADSGDEDADCQLADLLAEHGDLDALCARADSGNRYSCLRLARLLADNGDVDGLRVRADTGDQAAAWHLAGLLAKQGDLDALRARVCDRYAAWQLARLLADNGDLDEATQILRARADTGDEDAACQLARLLADNGDLDEAALTQRAGNGDWNGAWQLAALLAERGDLDGLRTRAENGDGYAAWQLAELLAGQGDLDGLRTRADAGDTCATRRLAKLLAERGEPEMLAQILRAAADAGDWISGWRLADVLARHGHLDELRARADTGEWFSARRLADLLVKHGHLDELRARVSIGDDWAAWRLADLLAGQGRDEEAEQLRRFGLNLDGTIPSGDGQGNLRAN